MNLKPFDEYQFLGKIALNPRGDYSPSEVYEYLDVVYLDGSSYYCVVASTTDEPSELSPSWKVLARGFPDAENIIRGIKGDAEIEYQQSGFYNITPEAIGLGNLPNYSLEEFGDHLVRSISFNGKKQELHGDVDIPVVNGLIINDKPIKHGLVHLHTLEGMVINDSYVQSGLVITDMVQSITLNGKYKRGHVELKLPERIVLNGEEVKNHKGTVELNVVDSITVNGKLQDRGRVDLRAVESLTVNDGYALSGDVELDMVNTLSINGSEPQRGDLSLDVVHGLSINGHKYRNGYLGLDIVEGLSLNGRDFQRGKVAIEAVESLEVNGRSVYGPIAKVDVVEGIEFNHKPLKLDDGIAEIKAAESIKLNGREVLNEDGVAEINAIEKVAINGELQKIYGGYVNLDIPSANGTVLYGICESEAYEQTKIIDLQTDNAELKAGALVFVNFTETNYATDLVFDINGAEFPVLIKGETINESNATTLRKNGLFSFLFDGESLLFHEGTTDPVNFYNVILSEENWEEDADGNFRYSVELPCLSEDLVNVFPALKLDPFEIFVMSQIGLYGYDQEDGKITLGCIDVPPCDLHFIVSVE